LCGCKPNANTYSYGYGDSAAGIPNAYGYSYGNDHTTTTNADSLGDPASADAKAAAHAVPSADAVRMVKE
jgi:hypothetical protein